MDTFDPATVQDLTPKTALVLLAGRRRKTRDRSVALNREMHVAGERRAKTTTGRLAELTDSDPFAERNRCWEQCSTTTPRDGWQVGGVKSAMTSTPSSARFPGTVCMRACGNNNTNATRPATKGGEATDYHSLLLLELAGAVAVAEAAAGCCTLQR